MLTALLLAATVAGTTFRIDSARSTSGFDLKATMHTVHGTTTGVSGEVQVSGEPGGARTLGGRIEIDAAALATGNDSRDAKLHKTTLSVAQFPKIVLVPQSFTPRGPAENGSQAGTLTGALTIRDVTKPVSIEAHLRETPASLEVDGTFDVPWKEFGMPDPSFMFVRVEDVAHAHFNAHLTRAGG